MQEASGYRKGRGRIERCICERLKGIGAGRSSKGFETTPQHPVGLTEAGKREECASCGSSGASRLMTEAGELLLCEGCANRLLVRGNISYWLPAEDELPESPEERFADLFKAARTLLKKGVTEEDQI